MRFGRLLLCGAAAGAMALAGCSSGTAASGDHNTGTDTGGRTTATTMVQLVDDVSAASEHVHTSHATMTCTVDGTTLMTGEGAFDLRKGHVGMSMTEKLHLGAMFRALGQQHGPSAGADTVPAAPAKPVTVTMALKGNTFYVKIPPDMAAATAALGGDPSKPWHEIDLSGSGANLHQFGSLAQKANPAKQLEKFKNAGTITKKAAEQLDGRHVTHYWITVDRKRMLAEMPDGAAKDNLRQQLSSASAGLPRKLPVQLWVDGRNLPLRLRMAVTVENTPMTVDVHYTGWGKPVTIRTPPEDEIGKTITPPAGDGH